MITLNGVALNPNLLWPDRDSHTGVKQAAGVTLGGAQVLWVAVTAAGRAITLQSIADQGWFTKAQKDSLYAMAQVPGAVYTLVIGGQSFSVVFMHNDPPAVDLEPLIGRAVDNDGDVFIGRIKLLTV